MATSPTDVKSQTIELSTEAFVTFCEDISGMFGVDMDCGQQESRTETIQGLNKRFKKLTAVIFIKAEGTLAGNFRVVFDKEGLFTLAGIIIMLPEQKILDHRKRGSAQEAEGMADAIGEAGNLLVGSWDRVFREELAGHGHFVQTDTFIGDPWDSPEEKIGLANDEEFLFVPYEMTVGSYPAFNCGVIFPKTTFGETSSSDTETVVTADEESQEKAQQEAKAPQDVAEKVGSKESDTTGKDDSGENKPQAPAEERAVETGDRTSEQPAGTEQEPSDESQAGAKEPVAEEAAEADAKQESPDQNEAEAKEPAAEEAADADAEPEETSEPAESTGGTEPATGPVSETIQRMAQSSTGLPGGGGPVSLATCAKDIMQKEVLWGDADNTVQQVMTEMQQADVGYMMVGADGQLEGLVSKSDIAAALSVYLKPMFAKWRRPIDDATLQIKIKWIMTRPVRTIKPDASLATIMAHMCQSGLRCLPVVDQQGKVAGLVTVFDILTALLNTDSDISTAGKTPRAPSLA